MKPGLERNDWVGIGLLFLVSTILGLYMSYYNPPPTPIKSGDCLEYREARQQGLFLSNVECVRWEKK